MRWYLLAINEKNAVTDGPWGYDDEATARERFTGYEQRVRAQSPYAKRRLRRAAYSSL